MPVHDFFINVQCHTHTSQSTEQEFSAISEQLILKFASQVINYEKLPLDVLPAAQRSSETCSESVFLLSPESRSQLI